MVNIVTFIAFITVQDESIKFCFVKIKCSADLEEQLEDWKSITITKMWTPLIYTKTYRILGKEWLKSKIYYILQQK